MNRNKKKKNRGKLIFLLIFFVVVCGLGYILLLDNFTQPYDSSDNTKTIVTIPMGSGVSKISDILEESNVIQNGSIFKIVSKIKGYDNSFKAGVYPLSPSMSMYEIMYKIQSGVSVGNLITIPEGYTVLQVAQLLEASGLVSVNDFIFEIENGNFNQTFISQLPSGPNRLEGFLFPETYDIPIDADSYEIINIMLNHFDKEFTSDYYKRTLDMGFTLNEIITIASMIEREAAVDEDRPIVASVVYNRLKENMPLQFCSTVQYILGDSKARLSDEDTRIPSPYNTYINSGLPPAPICSPGIESIRGALYPADTNYLFFVVDPKGKRTHKFAETYDEFLVYKREYTDSL